MAFEKEKLTFLAILTMSILTLFVGAMIYSLAVDKLTIKDFASQVGPMAGMLLGYWVRDNQVT